MKQNKIIKGQHSVDGEGVELKRFIGTHVLLDHNPFLLFDVFGSHEEQPHQGWFPPHPHRGFETLTYMFSGSITHEDNQGHQSTVGPGGIQWMQAGSGIIHSETPHPENGKMHGVQLWINSPATVKMNAPKYLALESSAMPTLPLSHQATIKVIAGTFNGISGPLVNEHISLQYGHLSMHGDLKQPVKIHKHHNGIIFLIRGLVEVNDEPMAAGEMMAFQDLSELVFLNKGDSDLLIVTGQPIDEPIVRRGPFVMNTQTELEQAFRDYRDGKFI